MKSKINPKKSLFFLVGSILFFYVFALSAFAATPSNGTVSPSSGTGTVNVQKIFATTYSDPSGWQHIQYVYFVINSTTSAVNCFFGYYNQNTNKLYLRDGSGTSWLGGFTPGSSNTIENTYAKLNCAQTTVSGSGNTLTVKWAVTLKSCFVGSKNLYLYVRDDSNLYQALTQKGTWTIPNHAPTLGTITPVAATASTWTPVNIVSTYSDIDTWINLNKCFLLINTAAAYTNCFYSYYDQNNNKLYLRNDTNTAWLGGYAPGSTNTIENSYVKLDCSKTTATGSSNTLSINWNIIFKSAFIGSKNTYLYVVDDLSLTAALTKKGTITITRVVDPVIPQITQLNPADASRIYENTPVVIKPTITDNNLTPVTYQFSVDGAVKQAWSSNATYNWLSPLIGAHTIKVEAKDDAGQSSKSSEVFILRKPMEIAN